MKSDSYVAVFIHSTVTAWGQVIFGIFGQQFYGRLWDSFYEVCAIYTNIWSISTVSILNCRCLVFWSKILFVRAFSFLRGILNFSCFVALWILSNGEQGWMFWCLCCRIPNISSLEVVCKKDDLLSHLIDHPGDWTPVVTAWLLHLVDKGLGKRVDMLCFEPQAPCQVQTKQWSIWRVPERF